MSPIQYFAQQEYMHHQRFKERGRSQKGGEEGEKGKEGKKGKGTKRKEAGKKIIQTERKNFVSEKDARRREQKAPNGRHLMNLLKKRSKISKNK